MFCFQCEQTRDTTGCVGAAGACGKKADVAQLQDQLTDSLIHLAASLPQEKRTKRTTRLLIEGLFTTLTNVNFDAASIRAQIDAVQKEMTAHPNDNYSVAALWTADEDIRSLKSLLLFGLRGIAAYAYHAMVLGKSDAHVDHFLYKGLAALPQELSVDELLPLIMEEGKINLACMKLLNDAHIERFGTPEPTSVPLTIEKGPFIVVSGHDLLDLEELLEQTDGLGINVYTHGEMLPAHAYPNLKNHKQLKGNFGTAWQNQQSEFIDLPAPVLFTTNCLMPVKANYADRIFTTAVVQYPGMAHVAFKNGKKDFSALISKARELGGYKEDHTLTGINGGHTVMTGFAKDAILKVADKIIDAVKKGAIRHFFLVGGCDGSRPGRNYYTEFVKKTPPDTIILTLACGKFRFNDLDLGTIDGLPRLLDVGQCNDAYSAIQIALALADAFHCGVNDLPLTLVLSWYEQKAVAILLTLLALDIKNIYIGPTLPAFLSPNVTKILIREFNLKPISTPEEDLKAILG